MVGCLRWRPTRRTHSGPSSPEPSDSKGSLPWRVLRGSAGLQDTWTHQLRASGSRRAWPGHSTQWGLWTGLQAPICPGGQSGLSLSEALPSWEACPPFRGQDTTSVCRGGESHPGPISINAGGSWLLRRFQKLHGKRRPRGADSLLVANMPAHVSLGWTRLGRW